MPSIGDVKILVIPVDFTDYRASSSMKTDLEKALFGTSYDGTKKFINKYQDKKIIWYFDIFAMGSVDVYLTLLQHVQ